MKYGQSDVVLLLKQHAHRLCLVPVLRFPDAAIAVLVVLLHREHDVVFAPNVAISEDA
jgi:hypothetical protein